MQKIALIGVGLMGYGIASNVLKAGYQLRFFNHAGNQPTDDLIAAGAAGVDRLADLTSWADAVMICVTGSAQVTDILTQPDGVLDTLRPGQFVIDLSTAIPASTQDLAAQATAKGGHFFDAAMTRTPREAAAGRLNLLIGGDAALYAQIEPLLAAFSENRFFAGAAGAGHSLKLLHNYVSLGMASLLAEAAAAARAAGVNPDVFVDCLQKGGGYGAALDRMAPYITRKSCENLQFSNDNALKDLGYFQTMMGDMGQTPPIAQAIHTAVADVVARGHGADYVPVQVDLFGTLPG